MTYEQAIGALARREFAPAIVAFRGRLAWDRNDGEAWMYLGIAYTETGHQAAALSALTEAETRLVPNAELAEAFGCAYLRGGRFQLARAAFEEAKRFPDCPASVYRNLGVLLLKTGDLATASETLDVGIARAPHDVMMLFSKVLVLEAMRHRGARGAVVDEMCTLLDDILARRGISQELAEAARAHRAIVSGEHDREEAIARRTAPR